MAFSSIKSSLRICLTPALVLATRALFLQRRLLLNRKLLDQLHVGKEKSDVMQVSIRVTDQRSSHSLQAGAIPFSAQQGRLFNV